MKQYLWTSLFGVATATTLVAQDPVPVATPGPLVPAYAQLPAYGYPVAPVGGGMVMPTPGMPGQPIMYGYPPVGFPAQPFARPMPMMMPISYQMHDGSTIVTVPMPLPGGPATTVANGSQKREAPPEHFGPHLAVDSTNYLIRRSPQTPVVDRE